MIELSGRQKRALRALGQTTPVALTVGKSGLSDELLRDADAIIERVELLKIRLPSMDRHDRGPLAQRISDALNADLVGVVGHTVLLYRPASDPDKRRITVE